MTEAVKDYMTVASGAITTPWILVASDYIALTVGLLTVILLIWRLIRDWAGTKAAILNIFRRKK